MFTWLSGFLFVLRSMLKDCSCLVNGEGYVCICRFFINFLAKKRNQIYIKFLVKKAPANIIKFITLLWCFMFVLRDCCSVFSRGAGSLYIYMVSHNNNKKQTPANIIHCIVVRLYVCVEMLRGFSLFNWGEGSVFITICSFSLKQNSPC